MAASEDYRAQAEARNRLEDTWKAGQEAAMFRWRAEQHAMQQVLEPKVYQSKTFATALYSVSVRCGFGTVCS